MDLDNSELVREPLIKHGAMQSALQDQLLKLDVEYGNAKGFFSATKNGFQALDATQKIQLNEVETSIPGAIIKVNDSISVTGCELIRSTQFKLINDSKLFDLVSRFVVLSNDRVAHIAGHQIQHGCKNIYHQYATDNVIVPVGMHGYIRFYDNGSNGHPFFENVFYVRDEAVEKGGMKRWIVHHRMIVRQQTANLIVRCCHPKFEGPLPLQKIIPRALKSKLFRIRERVRPNFPFMAVGESDVKEQHTFDIRTRVQILDE